MKAESQSYATRKLCLTFSQTFYTESQKVIEVYLPPRLPPTRCLSMIDPVSRSVT